MTDEDDDEAASGVPGRSERGASGPHAVSDSGRQLTNRNVVPRGGMPVELTAHRPPLQPDDFDVVTPVLPQPRDVFIDEDATLSHDEPDPAASFAARSDAIMARVRERLPRITPSPIAGPPPESRRAPTEPGHVEPRRRPTTPPPGLRSSSPPDLGDAGEHPAPPERPSPPPHHARPFSDPDRTPTGPERSSPLPVAAAGSALLDRVLRGVTVLTVLGLGAAGLAQPGSVLRGGIAWLGLLFFALAGWGAIVERVARVRVADVGLRAALGAAGVVAVGGLGIAIGVLSRPFVLAVIGAGVAGFAWHELTAPIAVWHRVRDGLVFIRRRPALGVLVVVLALLACVRLLGAVAALDRNPWDDDVAYTPLVKRLLDIGDLVEPFSFRRLGAYGGQTLLEALAGARGTLANVHLIDKGLCLGLTLLAITGYARERRTRPLWLALIAILVLVLPDTAINTASYWSGAALFLALYRCVVREHWALAGLVGAATCTLRQNFMVVVVVFLAAVLVMRLIGRARAMPLRDAWRAERGAWLQAAGVALAALLPWLVAAFRSNHTFLFPLLDGTWNHELSLNPALVTWPQKLEFLLACSLEPVPLAVIPIVAPVFAFTDEPRPGKPLTALFTATAIGFALLVLSLVGTESAHVWRYVFGFGTPLFIVLALEVSADDELRVGLPALGRWLVLAAIVLQIIVGRGGIPKQYAGLWSDVREAAAIDRHGDPSARAEAARYRAMQAALPAGAAAVFLLDDPAFLDFGRNRLANLDVPGFASPAPQLPAFRGAEPLREYLVAAGYRYVAFVRPDRSRYYYRREFWLQRTFWDSELFQMMGAYLIDTVDSLTELATTTRVLHDRDGLVVLDLGSVLRPASRRSVSGDEPTRRTAWARELADREGVHDAWSLTTRADVRFEDGVAGLIVIDQAVDDPRWFEVTHTAIVPLGRGTPIRPLYRRVHLRVRGTTDMQLAARIAIGLNSVYTRPRLDVSLDGELLASVHPDDAGRYKIEAVVPRDRLSPGWHDLYLVFSTISEPDKVVRDLRIARLESLEWSPR